MIYIVTDSQQRIAGTYYFPFGGTGNFGEQIEGLGKTEAELLQTGYLVESVPDQYTGEVPAGKKPELHYDGTAFSWELVDNEGGTSPVELAALQKQLEAQAAEIAELKAAQNAILGVE